MPEQYFLHYSSIPGLLSGSEERVVVHTVINPKHQDCIGLVQAVAFDVGVVIVKTIERKLQCLNCSPWQIIVKLIGDFSICCTSRYESMCFLEFNPWVGKFVLRIGKSRIAKRRCEQIQNKINLCPTKSSTCTSVIFARVKEAVTEVLGETCEK